VKIEKPGNYRTRDNRRVEVVAVRDGYAVGFDSKCPLTWLSNGQHWNWFNGTEGSAKTLDIVSEWREPVSEPVTIELCLNVNGEPFVRMAGNYGSATKVLARRTITITEGEGMSSG